jgi:branched-chain amino acid transport system substrate-binding protein
MITNREKDRGLAKVDAERRKVVKLIAAGSVGVITSPWVFQPARAAARAVKIGMISPQTGAIASFAEADRFVLAGANKALEQGLTIAGENHPVQIIYKDSQSNPNRASELAAQLINNERVDLMLASASSETCNPVSDQCELKGVPCITTTEVWQSWFFPRKGDPKTGFEWTYHFNWGFDMAAGLFVEMWQSLPTNKTIGTMFTNDPDGMAANDAQHGLPGFFSSKGFKVRNVGLYSPLADDFTAQISELKKADCDIVCGIFNPPQFAIFWTQCAQQNYRPKIVTPLKALLFPTAVEALGDRGIGMSTEVWWSHHHPFKSGLTGETAEQFCNAYEAATGKLWTQPIGFQHANLEVAVDVLKRALKLEPKAIRDAIAQTDYNSLVGHITWKGGPTNPVPNVCTTPLVGGQWKKGKKFKYDLDIVFNKTAPDIALDSAFEQVS